MNALGFLHLVSSATGCHRMYCRSGVSLATHVLMETTPNRCQQLLLVQPGLEGRGKVVGCCSLPT